MLPAMPTEVTQLLDAIESGDSKAAEELLPLAYSELRKIAAHMMANERAGHTLQPTALVHEAYQRLAGPDGEERSWESRGHFFSAAAEAMRRILIENARRKACKKRGANAQRTTFDEERFEIPVPSEQILAVDEALGKLEETSPDLAKIVKLRYFAGMKAPEIASALGTSESTVNRAWKSAKAWLFREISEQQD
jgi:RNA polymerase sigma factor (TIGR02999 family)